MSELMTFLMLTQVQLFVAVGVGRYKNMLQPALRMNLWIRLSGRNVNALILEEGETFADADVGFRHVVI